MSADAERTRRAARGIGLWVGGASALIVAVGVTILIAVILATSRPERHETAEPPDDLIADHVVVDVDRVLPWVLALGVAGAIVMGLIGWLTARRAVAPLAEALRLQRNFVSDASHELRTPLTALDSRIQILQRRLQRGEPIADTIERLGHDARMMDDVLTDLLLAAESGALSLIHI